MILLAKNGVIYKNMQDLVTKEERLGLLTGKQLFKDIVIALALLFIFWVLAIVLLSL